MNARDEPARLLASTRILDYGHREVQALVARRGWRDLPERERAAAVYRFVQNEVLFGYNASDDLPASQVLKDGIGQCNTKGTLLMALLRACGIPCRFHGFTIDKAVQRGAIPGLVYWLAPRDILHSWVEVLLDGRWIILEGFILDRPYLLSLQRMFPSSRRFCGYGAATPDLQDPRVDWNGGDTYIQKDAISRDYGVFDAPDEFYARHGTNLGGLRRLIYRFVVRHWMNRTVQGIRGLLAQ